METIGIIGAGFSSITAATHLAKKGYKVYVFEKNESLGGRARKFVTENGFTFDMGPSWYWMPDIIENHFKNFGKDISDYIEFVSLNPQFEMVFNDGNLQVPGNYEDWPNWIESIEKNSSGNLKKFMQAAQYKYEVGMMDFVNKPCYSWGEFIHFKIIKSSLKLNLLSNFRTYTYQYFKDPKIRALMEFPVIFLGASPKKIPALYSMMNYGGYRLGTWYPMGGFSKLVSAMVDLAESNGVHFYTNESVEKINIENNRVVSVKTTKDIYKLDVLISGADYAFTETLLPEQFKNYTNHYWESRTFAPSCLIYFLGIDKKIDHLKHHTLFFENSLDDHVEEIYTSKKWPEKPLFYVCCPSKTDKSVAPDGKENLFLLMPIANNLSDEEEIRERYLNEMIARIEQLTGEINLKESIIYKRSYCVSDFKNDYNAYGGNAYGLANTLNQTAVLKPTIRNKKIKNLWYTGQLTVPGPGVPPAIISGKIVAEEITKKL